MNRIKWWEWALLAVVVACASVLIADQAQARGILNMDLLFWLWR